MTLAAAAALGLAASGEPAANAEPSARITPSEARAWEPDLSAARRYASRRAGEAGIAVFDMRGRLHHWQGGGRARMASTMKVMLMVAYLRKARDRALTDEERELIRPMIRRSANTPATTIRDRLGRAPIERLARRAGMRHFSWNESWGHCRTSARDHAYFMRRLRRLVPERHWPFARHQLASIVRYQRWGIGQVDLRGWKLYFKGGWGDGSGEVDHQVALLRRDGRRIGVGILTEGNPSHDYGKRTLEGIARRLLRGLPR